LFKQFLGRRQMSKRTAWSEVSRSTWAKVETRSIAPSVESGSSPSLKAGGSHRSFSGVDSSEMCKATQLYFLEVVKACGR